MISEHKDNKSLSLHLLSEDFRKVQMDLSNYKLQSIALENQLILEKELSAATERNYQRALQDLQHYKIKNVLEKPLYNINDSDIMDVNMESVFTENEDLIKRNFELVQNINDMEKRFEELRHKHGDLEMELVHLQSRNEDLVQFNCELKAFVNDKKTQLLELNTSKSRIEELENASKTDSCSPFISLNINKIKELELKCFNLEKDNEKFRENHSNLMLLLEENVTLGNENERIRKKLQELENVNLNYTASDQSFEANTDTSTERHSRHIQRENEILKCQQTQISEQNNELNTKIASLEYNVHSLKQSSLSYQVLLHDKEQRIIVQDNEIKCLSQDCQSFRHMLDTFTTQCNLDTDSLEIYSRLSNTCKVIEAHRSELDQQSVVLDNLVQLIAAQVENMSNTRADNNSTMDCDGDIDRQMVVELRHEVERLNEEVATTTEQLHALQNRSVDQMNESGVSQRFDESVDQLGEMGFTETGANKMDLKDRHPNIFKKLSGALIESVKQLLGYSIELGPNGHVTCHNCLSDDVTEVLEFIVPGPADDSNTRPILIENSYTESIMNQINFQHNYYPGLLASITLDLLTKKHEDNSAM